MASGFGKRAGGDKLRLPWKGQTVLFNAIRNALFSNLDEVIIVVREEDYGECTKYLSMLVPEYSKHSTVIVNQHATEGMSASLRLGVQHCSHHSHAVLFLLADQVFFDTSYINMMCAQYRKSQKSILAPFYNSKRKNPVLFSLKHFKDMFLSLSGDMGARILVERYAHEVEQCKIIDHMACADLDTQEQYQIYKEHAFSWARFLQSYKRISVMGAGGKTQLIWNMARALWSNNMPCLVTNTTKMWNRMPQDVSLLLCGDRAPSQDALAKHGFHHVLLGSEINDEQKILGLSYATLNTLHRENPECTFLIEADGAREQIYKVHGEHEPCILPQSDLVIIVININIIGQMLSASNVHRAELLRTYFSHLFTNSHDEQEPQLFCSVENLGHMLLSPHGYLAKSVPMGNDHTHGQSTSTVIFFNGIESKKDYCHMVELCTLLHASLHERDTTNSIQYIYGSNKNNDYTLFDINTIAL